MLHRDQLELLKVETSDLKAIQEDVCSTPAYDSSTRKDRKYTIEMDMYLDEILADETEKYKILGRNTQQLTQTQIHLVGKENIV